MDELEHFEEQQKASQTSNEPKPQTEQAPIPEAETQFEPPTPVEIEPQFETPTTASVTTSATAEQENQFEPPTPIEVENQDETDSETKTEAEPETPSQAESKPEPESEPQPEEESGSKGIFFDSVMEAPEEGMPLGESFLSKLADLDKQFSIPEDKEETVPDFIQEKIPEKKTEEVTEKIPEPTQPPEPEPKPEPVREPVQEKIPEPKIEPAEDKPKVEIKESTGTEKPNDGIPALEPEIHEQKTVEESLPPDPRFMAAMESDSPNLQSELKNIEQEKKELHKRLASEKKDAAKKRKEEAKAQKVRRPIGAQLIAIITLIVIIAMGTVTAIVSYVITQDVRINAEENNRTINNSATSDCESRINNGISAARMFIDLLSTSGNSEEEVSALQDMFFERHAEIVAIYLPDSNRIFFNRQFLISRELDRELVSSYMAQEKKHLAKAKDGAFEIQNASPFFKIPVLAFFTPISSATENTLAMLLSSEEMAKSISSGTINQSYLINNDGIILVHNDTEKMMRADDISGSPLMDIIEKSAMDNSQTVYKDSDETEYIGAFKKFSNGNGIVITTVKTDIVLEGIRSTTRRNIYITAAILALAILVIWFFSRSLSRPLKELTAVVNEINKGNFNTELFNQMETTKRKDEIGVLGKSTKNEREILNTFAVLTNKGVTKAIITKAIDFEPHLKDITIFFSDIRGFTAISDGFKKRFGEKSAAQIIIFLNDYMARMVSCIRATGGVVDKFEGDAIMAAWGVLRNDGLDWETMPETSVTRALKKEAHDQYVKEDAISAITSSIAMRYSLMKYNKEAAAFTKAHESDPEAQYKPHIRIGAGLNCGRATVGFMGSYDKMEFTSIGDAVNLASRTEASNKACGTDVLLTQDMYELIKMDFIRCEENNFTIRPENQPREIVVEQIPVAFEVKGKGQQHFYGVVNMPGFDIVEFFSKADQSFELDPDCAKAVGPEGPKTLSEVRSLLGIPEPDFAKVNLGEEENKVKVAGS